jgi:hypothetical protein
MDTNWSLIYLFYISEIVLKVVGGYVLLGLALRFYWGIRKIHPVGIIKYIIPKKRWFFLALIIIFILSHVRQNYFQKYTEWNVSPIKKDLIIGSWQKGKKVMIFEPDGTIQNDPNMEKNRNSSMMLFWEIHPYKSEILIKNSYGEVMQVYHMIIFNGQYRLLDHWDAEDTLTTLGFSKSMRKSETIRDSHL